MKQILFISVFAFLFGCNPDPENQNAQRDSLRAADSIAKSDSIRRADSVSRLSLVVDSVPADTVPAEPTYPAKFNVTFTSSYCGGARPSEEIRKEKETPKPLYSSSLKFKNHFTGKEYILKTNTDGIAEGQMEEGKYDVFLTADIDPGLGTGFDPKCNLWLNQLLSTIKISSSGKMQDVNVHFICNPCDENMKRRP